MKLFIAPVLVFAMGAAAQLSIIQGVFTTISNDVTTLDKTVQGYNGGDATTLLSQSKDLNDAITSGTATVKASSDLSQTDALSLTSPVQALQSAVESLISDLNAKKCQLVAAGGADTVLQNLKDQQTASQALSDAATAKVPQALQSIANQLSAGIASAVQTGVTDFQDLSSCPAAPAGSSSAPSSSATGGGAPVSAPVSTGATTTSPPSNVTLATTATPSTYTGAAITQAMGGYAGAIAVAALFGAAL